MMLPKRLRGYTRATDAGEENDVCCLFAGRAQVPQYAVLQNEKIRLLGVVMRGFDEGITEVKRLEDAGL